MYYAVSSDDRLLRIASKKGCDPVDAMECKRMAKKKNQTEKGATLKKR